MKKVCEHWEQFLPEGHYGMHFFDEFLLRAQAASAEVFRLKSPDEAKAVLLKLVKDLGIKKVVAVECSLSKAAGLLDSLQEVGVEAYTDPADIRFHAETAELGISGVEFGVAETGSVCQDAFSVESRLISTLPPIHAVFMQSENIVPGIEDALGVIAQAFDQGYVSFVTGPSRTADIERVLTIGVHGPSRFIILAVDKPDAGTVN